MTALLLAPHNDDEILWCTFTILRHQPNVVVCLRSTLQEDRGLGITSTEREHETDRAMNMLTQYSGWFDWTQWEFPDRAPVWPSVHARLREVQGVDSQGRYSHCFAPAVEEDGHEQHNAVGLMADEIFGPENVTHYTTYTRSGGRTRGVEVVPDPWMIPLKLRALACYGSQILHDGTGTRDWFMDGIREYVV